MFRGTVPGMRYSCSEGQAGAGCLFSSLRVPPALLSLLLPTLRPPPRALLPVFSHALLLRLGFPLALPFAADPLLQEVGS